MITFQPKYTIINKTSLSLFIIQAHCEERGLFKIFPYESTVFHWTDSLKPQEVSLKLEGYEFSGNLKLDTIGELLIRLKSTTMAENVILSVQINEDNNCYQISICDSSFSPPYCIENLTKTTFKLAQKDSRADDFDILRPHESLNFAWSYPMKIKLLSIQVCMQSQDTDLGLHSIDKKGNTEWEIQIKDKKGGREYRLDIFNDKNVKVIRIVQVTD